MAAVLLVAASLGLSNFAAAIAIGLSGVDAHTRVRVAIAFGLFEGARSPVFCTLQGGRIDFSYVRHLLLARKANIDRRVHAHGLRHTYAAELAREKTPINVIRARSGTPRSRSPTATYATSPPPTSSTPCAPAAGKGREGGASSHLGPVAPRSRAL